MSYTYKTKPFPHQRKAFAETANLAAYGLLWEQGCVDAETEFLSQEGWVSIADWNGEPIAQWSPDTTKCCWTTPEYVKIPYSGPMLMIHGSRIPEQVVCPEHAIPVMDKRAQHTKRAILPLELTERLKDSTQAQALPAKWSMPCGGSGIPMSDEDLRLQVAVMADGSFPKHSPHTKRVLINLKKQRKIDRLLLLLGDRQRYQRAGPNGFQRFSFDAPLRDKVWPLSWWNASAAQRKILLEELIHWDGSVAAKGRGWSFCSRHETDADLVQFLAGCEGQIAVKSFSAGVWNVKTRGTDTSAYYVRKENVSWTDPPADGFKYCFKLPSGYWIARRKGRVFPTGNCGKTKPLIDTISYLYQQGKIKGVIVVAPNGVHRNWISDEIPAHMPKEVLDDVKYLIWESSKYDQVAVTKQRKALEKHDGLAIVLVCYEATIRPKFKTWAKRFLDKRPCMMILDESHKIKDPDSKVKTTCIALGRYALYRRIATGTPIERPFDIYAQLRFLEPTFWKTQGFPTFEDFKQYFGIFVERSFGGRSVSQLVAHKNLPELAEMVKRLTWRVTKEEAGLNLPPKLYTKRYYDMLPEQVRCYNELKDKFSTVLPSGDLLEASAAITRLLRLQQIVCGYVACEAEQPVQLIDPQGRNPRMDLAVDEVLEPMTEQSIIFSRFTPDIDELMRRLGKDAVRYDGAVNQEDRAIAKLAFQKGDVKHFVMSNAGSTGLTLVGASMFMNYANDFSLINRQQREDRCHRIGQNKSVTYLDLACHGTVDDYIIGSLIKKFDIVTQVTLDAIRPFVS